MSVCLNEETQTAEVQKENVSSDGAKTVRVCFVCTGNTCRSPMAAAVANAYAQACTEEAVQKGIPTVEAFSAGLYANDGEPISPRAIDALEKAGIKAVKGRDYHTHTAHTLTAEEAERADFLVGLGGGHCMELLMRFPQAAQKVVGMPYPIADPYGGDGAIYDACLKQIIEGVTQLLFSSHLSPNEDEKR